MVYIFKGKEEENRWLKKVMMKSEEDKKILINNK